MHPIQYPILILHLIRFDGFMRKIKEFVRYPSLLNLSSYVPNNTFELFGVLIHEGFSLNSGHYFSYIKGFDDKWYLMNDSMISLVSETTALSQKPYILFYRKKLNIPENNNIEKIEISNKINQKVEKIEVKQPEIIFSVGFHFSSIDIVVLRIATKIIPSSWFKIG